MFIVPRTTTGPAQLRGAELMLSYDHTSSIPLLLTAPEVVERSAINMALLPEWNFAVPDRPKTLLAG